MNIYRHKTPSYNQIPVTYLQTVLSGLEFTNSRGQILPLFTDIYGLVEKSTGEITKDSPLFWVRGKDFESTNTNDTKNSLCFFVDRDNTVIEKNFATYNLSLIVCFNTDYFELSNRDIKANIIAQVINKLISIRRLQNLRIFAEKENILQPLGYAQGEFDFDAKFAGARFDFEITDSTCFGPFTSSKSFC